MARGGSRRRNTSVVSTKKIEPSNGLTKASEGPQKRKPKTEIPNSNGNGVIKKEIKKRKLDTELDESQEHLAQLITDFNLSVNELFQLKEYKTIAYWNPDDFSRASSTSQVPEIFDLFSKEPEYQISWGADSNEQDLSNIPLRLQKKIINEREQKLLEKFPFKEKVLKRSRDLEIELLQNIKQSKKTLEKSHIKPSPPVKPSKTSKGNQKIIKKKQVVKQEEEEEAQENHRDEEYESDMDEGTHYKVKTVKYSIPPPIVTHPSHIPSWVPDPNHTESSLNSKDSEIIDYHPDAIQFVSNSKTTYTTPNIQAKIQNFLASYKSAIIDETNSGDFNYTPQEYEKIMTQQEQFIKKLYEKTSIEKRLELNGEKIERRKTVLPHSSNTKQAVDPFRSHGAIIPKTQGVTIHSTHHDYFLSHGMAFSRLHQQMRRQHQLRTKKIAQMIEQHFKKKKGEKERLAKEKEQNLKRISKMAVQAVKKRWIQASKVYRFLQLQKEEELKKIKGREHLSQMLEHSTQLLEAQFNKSSRDISEVDTENENDVSVADDHLSSSSDEDSDSPQNARDDLNVNMDENDMQLTVEELRAKYADIDQSIEPSSKTISSDSSKYESDSDDEDIDANKGLVALYGNSAVSVESVSSLAATEYTDEQKALIEKFSKEDEGISSESVSEDSLNDSSSSESDDDSEVNESNHKQVDSTKRTGLAALLGNGPTEDEEDPNDDVSADSDGNVSDDENMSTTDEEDEPKTPKSSEDPKMDEKENELDVLEEEINGSKVRDVPLPPLLRGTLRPYQKQGLNWLASLYNNGTNGILADEMGLGKTIQTISLLAYLAAEHHIWGPHLIVVPTSVMLNWEMEFKKFAPGFKVLTYYGSPQQRAQKRKGWNKPNAFHVCITSYQLVVHDHQSFKRRRWRYMILDEAHNIKNFRSARWRALLNFNTENRLLLTGTPLQNNLMELWSLLYFLMPSSKVNQAMPDGFANLEDFQTWFGRPVDKILEKTSNGTSSDVIDENDKTTQRMDEETRNTVSRLHQVLRPYLLRRLKKDVEKQMPGKYEHIIYCRLSKRQRYLYDDFMSRAQTKETLASGNFLSIINCLMQLRKVCNHPDLFEVRPIVTSLAMPRCVASSFASTDSVVRKYLNDDSFKGQVSLKALNLDITSLDQLNYFTSQTTSKLKSSSELDKQADKLNELISASEYDKPNLDNFLEYYKFIKSNEQVGIRDNLKHASYLNSLRCDRIPLLGESIIKFLQTATQPMQPFTDAYNDIILSIPKRVEKMDEIIEKYSVLTPSVVTLDLKDQLIPLSTQRTIMSEVANKNIDNPFHKSQVKLSIAFPDKSLLQFDCGKLQKLATLLQDLTANGHRALIFTQMTKVLDILEQFLNIHGYRYMRLDGATKIEDRQLLTEKFNRDSKIPVFILSTRSGGLGINLTGADTVIFYDSDWNPAMDKQCQDRCHRIGQSRDVHIYRFVSEYTIESNILRKANQKRQLDNVVIQEGEFTTDYFGKFSVKDLVNDAEVADITDKPLEPAYGNVENVLAQAEDEDDRVAANAAMKEVAIDDEDFDEESKAATNTATPSQTPGPDTAISGIVDSTVKMNNKTDSLEDVDYEDGVSHVDEYMLRFIANGYYWD